MRFVRAQLVAAVVLMSLAVSAQAAAQRAGAVQADHAAGEATRSEPASDVERAALPTPEQAEVEWDDAWDKVRGWQYPLSVGLLGFGFTARYAIDDPEPDWTELVGFEQTLLDLVAVREDPARENWRMFNDLTFFGSIGYRFIDSAALPIFAHDNSEVAWQMSWIDAQSFGVVAAVLWGTQIYVGRLRPTANHCDDPDRQGFLCDPNDSDYARSFIAGHTATAVAAAGLTCVHHDQMPLYGGGLADKLACGVMIGNATANAVTRSMVELHYPSDVVMGVALGLTAGWILPRALHYGWGNDQPDPAETARLPDAEPDDRPIFTASPTVIGERPGMMLMGRF